MNSKLPKLRAQVEDELRSLYVCPDHYHAQAEACLGGAAQAEHLQLEVCLQQQCCLRSLGSPYQHVWRLVA
jgi:hypothetical protein